MKYFGKYERFDIPEDADMGSILNADNSVGDIYTIDIEMADGEYTAWLTNSFGARIGYFGRRFSKKLALLAADGLAEKGILSFIAHTADEGKGVYWGEMCVICYDPNYEEDFNKFISGVSGKIADDVRPKIDLSSESADKVVESGGTWLPSQNIVLPSLDKDKAYVKRRRSFTDKLVYQGRAGNKGCYVLSWVFIVAVIAAIALVILALIGII